MLNKDTVRLNINISKSDYQKLKELSSKNSLSLSAFLRLIISNIIKSGKSDVFSISL